jgi:hypothetical protein
MKANEVTEAGFYWVIGGSDGDYVAEVEDVSLSRDKKRLYAYHRTMDYGERLCSDCWDRCEFYKVEKP